MVVVEITRDFAEVDLSTPRLEQLVGSVCDRFGLSVGTVGIAVVDDEQMRCLQRRFLGRSCTSDCLSFDLSGPEQSSPGRSIEIVVNGQMGACEAIRRGHSPEAELALYIVHGLLHQFGHGDGTPEQARKMHKTEDEILQHLGYGIVYNDRPK